MSSLAADPRIVPIDFDKIKWRDSTGKFVSRKTVLDALNASIVVPAPRIPSMPWGRGIKEWVRWTSGKSNYYISKLLNQFWNATSYSFPGTLYFALWTATLSASSTGSTAGETAYTSYARVAVTANTTNFPSSSAGSNIQNGTAITFAANTGSASTITYVMVVDASSTGNSLYWGSITSTTINAGDTPQININGLTASEA